MNNDTSKKAAAFIMVVLGFIALVAALAALNGFILSYMWEWFVVPFGLPSIGLLHAIGIAILVSLLTHRYSDEDSEGAWRRLGVNIVARLIAFGVAFLISFGMPA